MQQNRKRTPQQKVFIGAMAATNDATYAATKAGYAKPMNTGSNLMRNPAVSVEVRRVQEARISNELLPKALDVLEHVLTNDKASERGKIMAAKIVLDRTLGANDGASEAKELHEMTGDEIAAALGRLRSELANRAEGAKDVTPSTTSSIDEDPGVFD